MSVGLILIGLNPKILNLRTAPHLNYLRLPVLPRKDAGSSKVSELQLGFYTKQAVASGNKGPRQWERNVTRFNFLYNFILKASILNLHIIFKVESGFGIVININLQLFANITCNVHLNFRLKVESGNASNILGQQGIFGIIVSNTKNQLGVSLRNYFNYVATKNAVEGFATHLQSGQNARTSHYGFTYLPLAPVLAHSLLKLERTVLILAHNPWWPNVYASNFFVNSVGFGLRVISHFEGNIGGLP